MAATEIGIGIAAISAIASALSARSSARGVALGHRPYVYGEHELYTMAILAVRLHNDGPGTATEVRFRLSAPGAEPTGWSEIVRAMQPGEILPTHEPQTPSRFTMELPANTEPDTPGLYVETEFSDIRGARWRLRNDRTDPLAPAAPERIRSSWFDFWRAR